MVDEFDILAGNQTPAMPFNLIHANTAVQLRYSIAAAICTLSLPCVIDVRCALYLCFVQPDFLLVFILHGIFSPGAQIHEQNLMFTVTQLAFMINAALLVLVQNPQRDADVRRDEQLARQHDDSFHLIILNEFLTNFYGI